MVARRIGSRPAKYSRKRAQRKKGREPEKGFLLRFIDGPNQGQEQFFASVATLGRTDDNDVLVVEPGVSRRHARVFEEHNVYLLEDLGSANGTRLNGQKVSSSEVLRDGDYISLSETSLQFSVLRAQRGEATAESRLSDADLEALDRTHTVDGPVGVLGSRRRKLMALVVCALIVGGVAWGVLSRDGATLAFDQSNTPLRYSDNDSFFNAVYGHGDYDKTHKNRLIVHFDYLGGRVTLQYGAWGVDKVGELALVLNGASVGAVPLTMNRWVYGLKRVLPPEKLRKGAVNELVFNNTRNPPHADPWEVCYIQILQEAIPPPNPKEARHQFELAKKSWEDKELEPHNSYTALMGFKKARDLLEGLPEKPDLYQEAVDNVERVDKELTRRFQEGIFSARRAQKLDRDIRQARQILVKSLRYFKKEDFRYRELQRYLDALSK